LDAFKGIGNKISIKGNVEISSIGQKIEQEDYVTLRIRKVTHLT